MNAQEQAMEVGDQVRRARRSRDWTQAELAAEAGIAPGTVNSIENGRTVRPGNLRAVLDTLGIPPLTQAPREIDDGIQLAMDVVRKWLEKIPEGPERDAAVRELTRFAILGEGRANQ